MTEKHINVSRELIFAFIVGAIVWLIIAYSVISLYRYFNPQYFNPQQADVAADWIKKRHSYHGIHTSVYDPSTGEYYFIRNGKKEKL